MCKETKLCTLLLPSKKNDVVTKACRELDRNHLRPLYVEIKYVLNAQIN